MKFESTLMTAKGRPRKYIARQVNDVIKRFEENGASGMHSVHGHFLSQVLNYCVAKRIPFTLTYFPDGGYYLRRGSA